jgi:hypothetical protein
MTIEDFFVKLLAQLLLNVTVWLINRIAGSEYAANVIHAVQERTKRLGPARALPSAILSALKAAMTAKRFSSKFGLNLASGVSVRLVGQTLSASASTLSASSSNGQELKLN